ncbi:hypothetical protein PRUPE_4G195700 [Prunus persica]|uniref:Bulb-type lectin domain-containing protein n=1 Tax=Prunus persica TaxID=3760 RepID=A0A251PN50_PRUPE|nr:hypothetical protein PRUPE_4G195700 [Prunus persica]
MIFRGRNNNAATFSVFDNLQLPTGIWYKNIPVRTVVWVANRCNPINYSSGMLMINSTGNLVLLGQNKSVAWSRSTRKHVQSAMVQLLNSGNLVERDVKDGNTGTYLWQSFDYPSDTLLPGMKLGWDLRTGLKRSLSARKNSEDPCPGYFTFGIEMGHDTYPEAYIWKGTAKYYRSGPWNGLRFSGAPELRPNPLYRFDFVYNDEDVYYMYNLQNKSVISRLVLNQTTIPIDLCDNYGLCGANGNCIIGFKPKSQEKWNLIDCSDIRGGGTGCAIWFGDLIDVRQFTAAGQDLYIRMPASELGLELGNMSCLLNTFYFASI